MGAAIFHAAACGEEYEAVLDHRYAALYNKVVGDAFAPRNPYCMKIDTLKEPPMFKVTDTHYAKTWLLDPRSPKIEKPEAIRNIHEKLLKAFNI